MSQPEKEEARYRECRALLAAVTVGCRPWAPSPDAEDMDVWHEWDIPLAGTFRLGEDLVQFRIVDDEPLWSDVGPSLWQYAVIPAERAPADDQLFESARAMLACMDSMIEGQGRVIAQADSDLRITAAYEEAAGDR
jgi:hypothetical protein